jgi:hypothetical protein
MGVSMQRMSGLLGLGILAFAVVGCLSSGERSTGTQLPQASEELSNDAVSAKVSHNCSGGRCSGITVRFQNRLDEPVEILATESKIARAGVELTLVTDEEIPARVLQIPPKESLKATFVPVSGKGAQRMTYAKPEEVWCSLKSDSKCTDASKGEAQCAAAARAYYRQYVDLRGWLVASFSVKANSWKKAEPLISTVPSFMGALPPNQLAQVSDAPNWFLPNFKDVVFFRYECDDQCHCASIDAPRDFLGTDKFLPVEK